MHKGRQGVPHAKIRDYLANHPGQTVIQLAQAFGTTRGAMGSRLTNLFRFGDVVKRENGTAKPVSWFVAGKL